MKYSSIIQFVMLKRDFQKYCYLWLPFLFSLVNHVAFFNVKGLISYKGQSLQQTESSLKENSDPQVPETTFCIPDFLR